VTCRGAWSFTIGLASATPAPQANATHVIAPRALRCAALFVHEAIRLSELIVNA
jgi:hypothetical protein